MAADVPSKFRLVLLAPVYNDARAGNQLLCELGRMFEGEAMDFRILLVDDGSCISLSEQIWLPKSLRPFQVDVLKLRRNVGHQRAIALGMAYVHEKIPCDAVLVMDADGEDRPEDALRLAQEFCELAEPCILFAERSRRSESRHFQVLYRLYQVLHFVLTGIRVRVGNFSIVPARFLSCLATLPEMWNHYAAAVFHSRLTYRTVPTVRGHRYCDRSKMNYLALFMHGLQALSVFSDLIAVRLLVAGFALCFGFGALVGAGLLIHLASQWTVPPWTLYGSGALLLVLVLTLACFSLVMSIMAQRNRLDFLPIRDYKFFVDGISVIARRDE